MALGSEELVVPAVQAPLYACDLQRVGGDLLYHRIQRSLDLVPSLVTPLDVGIQTLHAGYGFPQNERDRPYKGRALQPLPRLSKQPPQRQAPSCLQANTGVLTDYSRGYLSL